MKTHCETTNRPLLNARAILTSLFILSLPIVASAQNTYVAQPAAGQPMPHGFFGGSNAASHVYLSVDGKPALVLSIPGVVKVLSTNGFVRIQATNLTLYVWAVPDAKKVDDALPRAAEIIKSEFLKFKTNMVMDMTIAGAPAKHVTGSGNEADDGDPGNAEVVLFTVGGRVFAGCVHGEADEASKARAAMMTVLKTAQAAP